ncbi:MAG: phosphoribosylformylglycinamidine synthase subunit PurQ [Clostridia bacterium]|nr:phosphoribosylformylglycinamidine synthase subunit PurQ [Clostridia bacterium]
MRIGVVVFPGSNCDRDALSAIELARPGCAVAIRAEEAELPPVDALVLPGGFAYGDYLRAGALAAVAPVMEGVRRFADSGRPVLGICNGFQVLCEAGLLPGALAPNESGRFVCEEVCLFVESEATPFTAGLGSRRLRLPVAHAHGRYQADAATLDRLERNGQVVFRYEGQSPNGSARRIAGVRNERGNVLGMMPHPERRVEDALGGRDGLLLFAALLRHLEASA